MSGCGAGIPSFIFPIFPVADIFIPHLGHLRAYPFRVRMHRAATNRRLLHLHLSFSDTVSAIPHFGHLPFYPLLHPVHRAGVNRRTMGTVAPPAFCVNQPWLPKAPGTNTINFFIVRNLF